MAVTVEADRYVFGIRGMAEVGSEEASRRDGRPGVIQPGDRLTYHFSGPPSAKVEIDDQKLGV